MRPRVFPAEDPPGRQRSSRNTGCFNEAAGIPRGRRKAHLIAAWDAELQ